jgi:hypothetical protein
MMHADLLMADRSQCLRWLVLRDLMGRDASDPEMKELSRIRELDPLVTDLKAQQQSNGAWIHGHCTGMESGTPIRFTSQALLRLGYLGFQEDHPMVEKGIEYLISQQRSDGSWPLADREANVDESSGYSMISLQTSIPLRALAMCGCTGRSEVQHAYEWLLSQRLPDGSWGTGIAAGNYGGVAGYRRLAHSRWGCRSNTTGALASLILHPELRKSPETRKALDLVLGHESRDMTAIGFEVARIVGVEPIRGFLTHFAHFDMAQILDFCCHADLPGDDERVADLLACILQQQGKYGLWEYGKPQASRWVTFELLRTMSNLTHSGSNDWFSMEPRTPFHPYLKQEKRF